MPKAETGNARMIHVAERSRCEQRLARARSLPLVLAIVFEALSAAAAMAQTLVATRLPTRTPTRTPITLARPSGVCCQLSANRCTPPDPLLDFRTEYLKCLAQAAAPYDAPTYTCAHSGRCELVVTPLATRSRTAKRTLTATATATSSRTPRATSTRTLTRVRTPSLTPTWTSTRRATSTRSATRTRTPTTTRTPTRSLRPTLARTSTPVATSTFTRPPTATRSATRSVATRTATPTRSHTATRRASSTPSATSTPSTSGPVITFFGLARPDGILLPPFAITADGTRIYRHALPQGFLIVVEARPGASNRAVGRTTSGTEPALLPHFQMVSANPLGNPTGEVCDNTTGNLGGVPPVDPALFGGSQGVVDAINDLGCRFSMRGSVNEACTVHSTRRDPMFANTSSTIQFCSSPGVGAEIAFPVGDTRLSVRVLDILGNAGPTASIIVRIQPQ